MVQIIENRADIVGTVQSSENNGALLNVLVDNVSAVEGYPNLADDAVGQIVAVNVGSGQVQNAAAGARVEIRVRKTGLDRYAAV
jgi:hypothetical protein